MKISLKPDLAEIQRAITLLYRPGDVVELRVPKSGRSGTISGYFNDLDKLIQAVYRLNGNAPGVYATLNPARSDLIARAHNRVKSHALQTTNDADILCRRWLLVDCDARRPSGISSSQPEHDAALRRAREIRKILGDLGWPAPVLADSGNGAHLLYGLAELPNDTATAELLKGCLQALSQLFSDEQVDIDQSVFNASRISKVYGTVARKGDPTPERPHRMSRLLDVPQVLKPVSRTLLEALVAPDGETAKGSPNGPSSTGSFSIERWISENNLQVFKGPESWSGGLRWILAECPFDPQHKKPAILQLASGAIVFRCLHKSCAANGWRALRDRIEPGRQLSAGQKTNPYIKRAGGGDGDWERPIPFHQFDLPPFPSEALPDWLRDFVVAEATATQTPVDLAGMLAITVVAAACAKKVEVRIKKGYVEPLNIFTVTALPPGNRKSAVFSDATGPLSQHEESDAQSVAKEIARLESARKIKEAQLKRLEQLAARAKPNELESFAEAASQLAIEIAEMSIPSSPRYIVDDCTPERLATILRDQGGRIAVMSPEGDVFDLIAGRYSAGASNLGVYLKGHAGDTLRVDRVGRPPEFVRAPALTVGLAVQPEVIRGLIEKPGFRGRGLLGRFLYAMPFSLLGRRDPNPPPVPDDVRAAYHSYVLSLLELPGSAGGDGNQAGHLLDLDAEAQKRLQEFETCLEPQLAEFGELGSMSDWAGKLVGAVGRIAGILHMAAFAGEKAPWEIPISRETVECAIRIGMYLIPHAKAAFAEMGADATLEHAKCLLRWIENKGLDSFTKRDLHQGMKGRLKRVEELDSPIALLEGHGHIRKRTETEHAGPGRPPSPTYEVNPFWTPQNSHNSQNRQRRANSEDCESCEAAGVPAEGLE